jgi:hypothetical protein
MTSAHTSPSAFVETSADRSAAAETPPPPTAAETAAPPANTLQAVGEPESSTPIPTAIPPPTSYYPSEYRWVPVRRRPRSDGWTEEKQRRFIEVLADTGRVALAAKAVGLSRQAAYELKRSAQGAAFSRAWDAARLHAGALLEDIAFDRAIEGREENVFNECGEVIATKHVPDNRLLTFLLKHLLPDRYGNAADALANGKPPVTVDACLRDMEPQLPAPAETLLGAETLADELQIADIMDGKLPRHLSETRAEKTEAQRAAERYARGKAACEKSDAREELSDAEFSDMCFYLDAGSTNAPTRRRYK